MSTTHQEFVDGLRGLADWIESHPETIPEHLGDLTFNVPLDGRDALVAAARALGGNREKAICHPYYVVRRRFGPKVAIDFYTGRDKVCRKVVVGTREVPARVLEAHVEEIVEWQCDEPLLADPKVAT